MKKTNVKYLKFKSSHAPSSEKAAAALKKVIAAKNLDYNKIHSRLEKEIGVDVSQPTFLKWMRDPYHMNIYELKAVATILKLDSDTLINIVFGRVKVAVMTKIDAIAV